MNLFEMTAAAKELYELLSSDQIDEQTVNDTLDAIGIEEKLESYVHVQKTLEAELEAHKAEKKRHEARISALQKNIDRLKAAEIEFIRATGKKKAAAGTFILTLRENESTEVLDASKIPEEYFKPQPAKPDLTAIKKAIKDGAEIEGARIVKSYSVTAK